MDVGEQVNLFYDFFEQDYHKDLVKQASKGQKFLKVDFLLLSKFNPELAELLLEKPEDTIRAAELAIANFDVEGDTKNFRVRFYNLPDSQRMLIREIRADHINKLLQIEGLVRQKSDVRPQVMSARFECPTCGNVITVLQTEVTFKEPTRCSCGRKGKFKLLSRELVDAQRIVLEEAAEDLDGGEQPKRFSIFLKSDLVSPMSDKKSNPGSKVRVNGIIKDFPIDQHGVKTNKLDLYLETMFFEPVQEDFYELAISPEEEAKIREIAEDPKVMDRLRESLAPSIYGHGQVKEAILLMMCGGVSKKRSKGDHTRGDIHVLLVGDPGSGKSQMLKRVGAVAPKSRYVSGKGASGTGLTASVVKDEFLKGWALEAGTLVLANKGICCIDELDKMSKEDQVAMHEALEQQTISIAKANIQATLRAETTVLAAANPRDGRFDPYELIAKQIELPPTILNRFDLIFIIRDLPSEKGDRDLANFLLKLHQTEEISQDLNAEHLDTDTMKRYLSFARRLRPKLTDAAFKEIQDYYVKMRNSEGSEGKIKAIPISARQLEALIRLSEASAKLELRDKVLKRDARRAIDLLQYSLMQVGLDPETGKIDIDTLTTGITASHRNQLSTVREVINELEKVFGKQIPMEDVERECEVRGVDKEKTNEILDKLRKSGDIFSPKHGIISKIE
jgi:replicative DNA helicase Mcm